MLASVDLFESLLICEAFKKCSERFGVFLIHKPEICKWFQKILIWSLEDKGFE